MTMPTTELSLENAPATAIFNQPAATSAKSKLSLNFSRADLYVLICLVLWGFNGAFLKIALNFIEPLAISIIRNGIGGLFLLFLTWRIERSLGIRWQHLGLVAACALSGITFNHMFFVYALKNTSASQVALLGATTPLFAVLLAWVLGQGKIKAGFWLSLPVSLGGVALIVLSAGSLGEGNWLGAGLSIGVAATLAIYTVLLRPLLEHYSALKVSAYVSLAGMLGLLPFGYSQLNLDTLVNLPLNIWLILLFCSIGAVGLSNLFWFSGVKQLGSQRTAVYNYLQPFMGVCAAFLVLNEAVGGWQIVGGLIVIAGLLLNNYQGKSKTKNS